MDKGVNNGLRGYFSPLPPATPLILVGLLSSHGISSLTKLSVIFSTRDFRKTEDLKKKQVEIKMKHRIHKVCSKYIFSNYNWFQNIGNGILKLINVYSLKIFSQFFKSFCADGIIYDTTIDLRRIGA